MELNSLNLIFIPQVCTFCLARPRHLGPRLWSTSNGSVDLSLPLLPLNSDIQIYTYYIAI